MAKLDAGHGMVGPRPICSQCGNVISGGHLMLVYSNGNPTQNYCGFHCLVAMVNKGG